MKTRSASKTAVEAKACNDVPRKELSGKKSISMKPSAKRSSPSLKTSGKKIKNDINEQTFKDATARKRNKQNPWYDVYTNGEEEYNRYMSTEWGYETRGDVALFEKLCLEGAQSGLSWRTILHKRNAYRKAFYNFEIAKVAAMTEQDVERIMSSSSSSSSNNDKKHNSRNVIVRHKGKIEAIIHNAQCVLQLQQQQQQQQQQKQQSVTTKNKTNEKNYVLDSFLWSFLDDKPILNRWKSPSDIPSQTVISQAMSKALKQLGFRFVGPTTCYAFMQSEGMVIDHPVHTPEWEAAFQRLKARKGGYQEGNSM